MTAHEPSWSRAVYHLYVVRTDDREGLMDHLKNGRHRHRDSLSDSAAPAEGLRVAGLPRKEISRSPKAAAEIVSLPMFPQLTAEQQVRVVEEIVNFI